MADLDTLRPEVREAVDAFDIGARVGMTFGNKGWNIIRAELLRLVQENADLLSTIELDEQVWVQRDETMHKWIGRAWKAEAELAALKARITAAPVAHVRAVNDSMGGITRTYVLHEGQASVAQPTLDGKRVRLVVEE